MSASNNLPPGVTARDVEGDSRILCVGCGQPFNQCEDEIHCPRCQHADDQDE